MADVTPSETPELMFDHFTIDLELDANEQDAVFKLERLITTDANFAKESLELFLRDKEITSALLDFLREHPEGMHALQTWEQIFDNRIDLYLDPSEEIATKIENDPYINSIKKNRDSDSDANKLKIRWRRMTFIIDGHGDSAA